MADEKTVPQEPLSKPPRGRLLVMVMMGVLVVGGFFVVLYFRDPPGFTAAAGQVFALPTCAYMINPSDLREACRPCYGACETDMWGSWKSRPDDDPCANVDDKIGCMADLARNPEIRSAPACKRMMGFICLSKAQGPQ